jgi:hypothetical protein
LSKSVAAEAEINNPMPQKVLSVMSPIMVALIHVLDPTKDAIFLVFGLSMLVTPISIANDLYEESTLIGRIEYSKYVSPTRSILPHIFLGFSRTIYVT